MYQENDLQQSRAQYRSRLTAVLSAAGVFFAAMIVSFILRLPQVLTMILTCIGGVICIFCLNLLVFPVRAYCRHIDHALHGRTRKLTGVFISMDETPVKRDGVMFRPFTVNVGAGRHDDGVRLFYYDANLPVPEWKTDEKLTLTSYDSRVTDWVRA